jgi:hypothetical protein
VPPPDVFSEALALEAHGDVFAAFIDIPGVVCNDSSSALPVIIDTDGDTSADVPPVLFTMSPGASLPVGVFGADILTPGAGTPPGGPPAPDPTIAIPFAVIGLTPGDNIDALWADPAGNIIFSLDPLSASLASPTGTIFNPFVAGGLGCDPCDLIHALPGVSPPTVVAQCIDMGLASDGTESAPDFTSDNLNALWITDGVSNSLIDTLIPVELSIFGVD